MKSSGRIVAAFGRWNGDVGTRAGDSGSKGDSTGREAVADGTIEIEGEERPAVVATFLNRFYA